LAALISNQGLVPKMIGDTPVSHAEMERNVMAAWREYRRQTVPWTKSLPTIWVARWIRDVLLLIYHTICRHRSYAGVRSKMAGRTDIPIEFLGLFDTVEAFGVPIEELRLAIDWAIWPISFRNHRLSPKVKQACHALALDDERTSFHPLRIDQSDLAENQVVNEVWFAGVHSDIGGGYPESTLSFVPLVWMVEQLRDRLRFQPGTIDHFREYQSAIGPMHDSRSGAAVLYRYDPRQILGGDVNGGDPVVHFAVVERMLLGCDDYAPVMLPADCKVLLPDETTLPGGTTLPAGTALPLRSEHDDPVERARQERFTREAMKAAYLAKGTGPVHAQEAEAFTEMRTPNTAMSSLARDTVWWRRVAYFSLLVMVGVIALWPWIARALVRWSEEHGLNGTNTLSLVTNIDWLLSAVAAPFADVLKNVLPSYVLPWLKIAVYYPVLTSIVGVFTYWLWSRNGALRDTIRERARLAWKADRKASRAFVAKKGLLLSVANFMRHHAGWLHTLFARRLMPAGFLFAIFSSALLIVCNSVFTGRVALGDICSPPMIKKAGSAEPMRGKPVSDDPTDAGSVFETRKFCWWSGLAVEKGRKYRVWLDIEEPWFDRTIMTGVNGFDTDSWTTYLVLPMRRLLGAAWFQPVVRVGTKGMNDIPLEAVNVMPADEQPRRMNPTLPEEDDIDRTKHRYPIRVEEALEDGDPLKATLKRLGDFQPIAAIDLPAAGKVWGTQNLTGRVVAEFVAPDSGELFFYVNDAVQIFPTVLPCCWTPRLLAPFQGWYGKFYDNNSGTARIKVQRLAAPPKP
jgi:hypothetical protein